MSSLRLSVVRILTESTAYALYMLSPTTFTVLSTRVMTPFCASPVTDCGRVFASRYPGVARGIAEISTALDALTRPCDSTSVSMRLVIALLKVKVGESHAPPNVIPLNASGPTPSMCSRGVPMPITARAQLMRHMPFETMRPLFARSTPLETENPLASMSAVTTRTRFGATSAPVTATSPTTVTSPVTEPPPSTGR